MGVKDENVLTVEEFLLKLGEHAGPCTNKGTLEPCELHAEHFDRRRMAAKEAMARLAKQLTGPTLIRARCSGVYIGPANEFGMRAAQLTLDMGIFQVDGTYLGRQVLVGMP